MRPVICIGSAVIDMIVQVDQPVPRDERIVARDAMIGFGGLAATAAVALARLGVPVSIVGTVGDDDASRLIREALDGEGVETRWLRTGHGRPMMSAALVDRTSGDRAIISFDPGVGPPVLDGSVLRAAREAAWVHVDQLGLAAVPRLRAAGVATPISLDHGNPAPGLELSELSLYAPTEARLRDRYPGLGVREAIRRALEEGPSIVAVTRGRAGSLVGYRSGRDREPVIVEIDAYEVEVVSTLGAGDVFHGALVAALVRGLEVPQAVAYANAAAALSCRALDGRSAIPTWAELEAFIESGSSRKGE